jgi:hypothetical protein
MRRSEADTAELLPKISLVEVDRVGIGRSISVKVLGSRLIKELVFEYLSEGLKGEIVSKLDQVPANIAGISIKRKIIFH